MIKSHTQRRFRRMIRRPLWIFGTAVLFLAAMGGMTLAQRQTTATPGTSASTSPVRRQTVAAAAVNGPALMPVDARQAMVNQYCVKCHNEKLKSGDMSLTQMDFAHVDKNPELAEKII